MLQSNPAFKLTLKVPSWVLLTISLSGYMKPSDFVTETWPRLIPTHIFHSRHSNERGQRIRATSCFPG